MLEKFFNLKQNKTTVRTEVLAGITTFMTMAYILSVNPDILSATGTQNNFYVSVNTTNVFTSTAIRAGTTGPLQDYGGYVSKWMYLAIEQTSIGFLLTIKDKVNNITEQFYCLFPSQSISAPPTPITTIPNMTLDSAFVAGLWNTNIKPFFQVRSINNFSSTASSCDLDYFGIDTKYDRF